MALCSVSLQQRMCVSVHVWTLFKLFTKGMGLLNVVIDTADVMSESVKIARKMFLSHFFFLMLFKPVCMCKHRFFKFFFSILQTVSVFTIISQPHFFMDSLFLVFRRSRSFWRFSYDHQDR